MGRVPNLVVWLLLLAMPYWLPHVGGYVELGSRMVVLGLAAMALNFLLGFTGVLSFGHAAYFGLGAYGAGMTIRYLVPSTGLALVVGLLVGAIAAAIIGPMIVRLRGVYFAMVTIAFGQVFYFTAFRWSSVTGGDDGLTGWTRQPLSLGFTTVDIARDPIAFYFFLLAVLAVAVGVMAWLLRSPFGRTLLAIRENERRARFLGIPVDRHHLDLVDDLLRFRQRRRCALRPAQQLRRSARAILEPVRRLRDHGGARRHALLLGPADRRGDLRHVAGLPVQPDRKLDVVRRPVLRSRCALLPSRHPGHASPRRSVVSMLRVENSSKCFAA